MDLQLRKIESMIYQVRVQKVMLDSDLAELYKIETKRLNEQVKRNKERFPYDFMFQLTSEEYDFLKSQFATSKGKRGGNTNYHSSLLKMGVAMLSGILNSTRAIQINIAIMRIFTKLRSFLMLEKNISNRMDDLENNTNKMFKIVFERLDDVEETITPTLTPNRKKIGIKKLNYPYIGHCEFFNGNALDKEQSAKINKPLLDQCLPHDTF